MSDCCLVFHLSVAALALREGIQLVDVFAELATPDRWLVPGYAAYDGLHLSVLGERAVAEAVYRVLHPPLPPSHD
jgi:lysophospholipase L1-like esterase